MCVQANGVVFLFFLVLSFFLSDRTVYKHDVKTILAVFFQGRLVIKAQAEKKIGAGRGSREAALGER